MEDIMKIKQETLKALMARFKAALAFFLSIVATCHVSVSRGNKKIEHVLNVSLPPVMTCGNCSGCANTCYAVKNAIRHGRIVINCWARNYAVLLADRERYFNEIETVISRRRTNKYFRWHVSGEIVDYDYFAHMVDIARRHPDFTFWTYTKMYHIVNNYCLRNGGRDAVPANFHIMFSAWPGMNLYNPYNFPTFEFIPKEIPVADRPAGYYCPGNCNICRDNGRGCVVGESTKVNEH